MMLTKEDAENALANDLRLYNSALKSGGYIKSIERCILFPSSFKPVEAVIVNIEYDHVDEITQHILPSFCVKIDIKENILEFNHYRFGVGFTLILKRIGKTLSLDVKINKPRFSISIKSTSLRLYLGYVSLKFNINSSEKKLWKF